MWMFVTAVGLLLIRMQGCSSAPADSSIPSPPAPGHLYIYPWSVFSDMAVLDWYIRLQDKERMAGCDLSYGAEAGGNTTSVQNFLPLYRTIKIQPLTANTSYWVHMVCKDKDGGWHASDTLNFTTGTPVIVEPKLAAVQIPVKESGIQMDRLNRGMLSIRPSKSISPHVLMGLSCTILSLVVLGISSLLVAKKYQASDKMMEEHLQDEGIVVENDINLSVDEETSIFVQTDVGQLTDSLNDIIIEEKDQDMNKF